jgi:hypothetical protein
VSGAANTWCNTDTATPLTNNKTESVLPPLSDAHQAIGVYTPLTVASQVGMTNIYRVDIFYAHRCQSSSSGL